MYLRGQSPGFKSIVRFYKYTVTGFARGDEEIAAMVADPNRSDCIRMLFTPSLLTSLSSEMLVVNKDMRRAHEKDSR